MTARQDTSLDRRTAAARLAAARPHPTHRANGDERRLRAPDGSPTYAASFTKCLHHDEHGFVRRPSDYSEWVRSVQSGDPRDVLGVRIGPGPFTPDGGHVHGPVPPGTDPGDLLPQHDWAATYAEPPVVRAWESQGAGLTFDLEGPDAAAVTMPPAPAFASQELVAEMAEVYAMALCRDVPFATWAHEVPGPVEDARAALGRCYWFRADRTDRLDASTDVLPSSRARRRVLSGHGEPVPLATLFRGSTPGERLGPYVSQLLLVGTPGVGDAHAPTDGMVGHGAGRYDQRVRVATPDRDYLESWPTFRDVQDGADLRRTESYVDAADGPTHRFVETPRDLATYVHHDALYQAYLNACLVLLGRGAPVDPGLPFVLPDHRDKQQGFAQFGGPHVLTLVTEVATRALKAVRHQKYGVHRRLRPEALGGWMFQRRQGDPEVLARLTELEAMESALAGSSRIGDALDARPGDGGWLLPMAFPEGSPTHPSYGAGHAAVGGACVTVLKAWFDHGAPLLTTAGDPLSVQAVGGELVDVAVDAPLTVEGELNKLAGNIALGRGWAGVHYYSDYWESFRLGEQVALGILEEQKLCYAEPFTLTVPLHDGTTVEI